MEMRCYYLLPDDLEKKILSFLSVLDRWHMLQVNRDKSRFSDEYHQSLLAFYQHAFKVSCLWQHLPQIVVDGSLSNYFKAFVPAEWLREIKTGELGSFNKLVQSAHQWIYSKDLVSEESVQQIPDAQKFLITQLPKNQSIQDFLSAPYLIKETILTERKQRLVVARTYRHVEEVYNLLLLFLLVQRSSAESALLFVADGRLSRWLKGFGILGLTYQSNEKKLLSNLIKCSLNIHELSSKCSFDKEVAFQSSASDILSRLTDDDCYKLQGVSRGQRPILMSAIKNRCFPIIDSLGPIALGRVVEENPNDDVLLSLLERKKAMQLSVTLSGRFVPVHSFQTIVNNCKKFMDRLLSELTLEQMCDMIKPLIKEQFICLLNSQAFLGFLKELDAQYKRLMIENTLSRQIAITCSPSELLQHFFKVQPNYKNEITASPLAEYLNPVVPQPLNALKSFEGGSSRKKPTQALSCVEKTQKVSGSHQPTHAENKRRFRTPSREKAELRYYRERPAKVILSWSSKQARDILVLLREETIEVWDIFPKSNLLDKFTETNDFIELYLMYNVNQEVQFPKEITLKCGQHVKEKILIPKPYPLDFIYWKIFNSALWDKLSHVELEFAATTCGHEIHAKLSQEIKCLWVQKKAEEQAQKLSEISQKSSTDVLPKTIEKSASQNFIGDSDEPKTACLTALNEDLKQSISMSPEVPQILASTVSKKETTPLLSDTQQQPIPVIEALFLDKAPLLIQAKANDLTTHNQEPIAIADTKTSQQTQRTSQKSIHIQPLNSTFITEDTTPINILSSIAKGLLVGLLMMGITMLLVGVINYDPHVLLVDSIISDAIIGAIAGAFSWVVATACFLVDAEVCVTSSARGANEEDKPAHDYDIPGQNEQAHGANSSYDNQPAGSVNKVDTPVAYNKIEKILLGYSSTAS